MSINLDSVPWHNPWPVWQANNARQQRHMPSIFLTVSGQDDPALTRRLADQVARLTCEVLKKEHERTTVIVRYVAKHQWFIVGRSLAEHGKNAFRLEVTVTDETNTRLEKAAFQRAAFTLLSDLMTDVHPHSNIHIVDGRATAYGYGGLTQASHYQEHENQT
jgi:4-oxalocrotonate tautomerase